MEQLCPQSIDAIAEVVTGGSAYATDPTVGQYRSGPKLERFFAALNIDLSIGNSSRVPTVIDKLKELNWLDPSDLLRVIEAACNPADYVDEPENHTAALDYLNRRLAFDGLEIRQIGQRCKVVVTATATVATAAFGEAVDELDYASVQGDLDRAIEQAEADPEDAITSACSIVESVCKCILDDMGESYPAKQDIRGLVGAVGKQLNLSPARTDLPAEIENDIRQILGGLMSVTGGIGALRTHAGDAHGRGKRRAPVDARIARLAIHAASTISLFYIETWNKVKQHG